MVKKYVRRYHRNLNIAKAFEKMVNGENYVEWERYCNAPFSFIFFVFIFIHISANTSRIGLKFSQKIIHT